MNFIILDKSSSDEHNFNTSGVLLLPKVYVEGTVHVKRLYHTLDGITYFSVAHSDDIITVSVRNALACGSCITLPRPLLCAIYITYVMRASTPSLHRESVDSLIQGEKCSKCTVYTYIHLCSTYCTLHLHCA